MIILQIKNKEKLKAWGKGNNKLVVCTLCGNWNFSKDEIEELGNELNAERKKWTITANIVKEINGIRIPVEMEATWDLDSGDWNWLKLVISEIEYNTPKEY